MAAIAIADAADIAPARLHATFTQAFADYLIGPFQLASAQWPQFLDRQGVVLRASKVALADGVPVAFCLVAPRPECGSWRLATMGALAAARGSGAAPALLDDFLARARASGVAAVELECFARNERALRLYAGRGFEPVDELHGYIRAAAAAGAAAPRQLAEIAPQDAFDWLDASGCALPFQVTARSLRALPQQLRAWRHGSAQAVASVADDGTVHLHSLVDLAPAQHAADALVEALLAAFAGHAFRVPQLQRQALGGAALERHGFARMPLHQVWMRRALSAAAPVAA